jgi:mannitol-1-phosphate/altronate dehydrogenase
MCAQDGEADSPSALAPTPTPRFARPLRAATLAAHARHLDVPRYDRDALAPGVVHISVGSFHRAHQAVYFDDLARLGHRDWGVLGVSLHRPHVQRSLAAQDGLYTVVARGADGDRARVVGAIRGCLFAPRDREAVLRALAHPRTRLVTLTITADGYADAGPGSAQALLVAGLARRRRRGLPPFTVLSCDNVPDNGALTRAAVVAAAEPRDPSLAAWIEAEAAFPASMVDRITPRATDATRALVAREYGVVDRCPVVTEPFRQWVIEDRFSAGRPPLEAVGGQLADDVRPHALIKTRMLNAAHCALGYLGALAGHATTAEAMDDPALAAYVRALLDEVRPLLPPVPGLDAADYADTVRARLANPVIGDRLARLRRNGASKMRAHVLTSLAQARAAGRPRAALALAAAGWLRSLDDPDRRGVRARLADPAVGGPLAGDPGAAEEIAAALDALMRAGVRRAARSARVRPGGDRAALGARATKGSRRPSSRTRPARRTRWTRGPTTASAATGDPGGWRARRP